MDRGISSFVEACEYVRLLPYGRNTNRTDRLLVLEEQCGTCSGKHALLAELALEHGQPIDLMIGIFRMTKYTHPQVSTILDQHNLEYLPELHTYFRIGGKRLDFTGIDSPIEPAVDFVTEKRIAPHQVEKFKTAFHKEYLGEWLKSTEGLAKRFNPDSIWRIREMCIAARTKKSIA